jgi:hypothetical protein
MQATQMEFWKKLSFISVQKGSKQLVQKDLEKKIGRKIPKRSKNELCEAIIEILDLEQICGTGLNK